ncbi:gamma-glutamyl-gamma-aminobutyrate hydrolase family protein [bacterium]|nr:gamma-glutamyl-gamma-aminobutyrate hydrolase family protein [bacterium]
MKLPLIGLTMDHSPATDARPFAKGADIYYLNDVYIRYVEKAGCLFLGLPTTDQRQLSRDYIRHLDGLLLTGGNDVFSGAYGETQLFEDWQQDGPRTFFEIELINQALEQNKPILGICRGFQMLNVALGGSLYQDIALQRPDSLQHRSLNKPVWNAHPVRIQQGSLLHRVLGRSECRVNTSHHQAVKQPAPSLNAVAWAPDGVIEGLESPDHRFVLGVQWHPEAMGADPTASALIDQFVQACKKS